MSYQDIVPYTCIFIGNVTKNAYLYSYVCLKICYVLVFVSALSTSLMQFNGRNVMVIWTVKNLSNSPQRLPHVGSGAVMHLDLFDNFGAKYCLFHPSLFTSLLICFLTYLLLPE